VIVDSSAVIAILKMEDDAESYAMALESAGSTARMSAAVFVETSIVVDGMAPEVSRAWDALVREAQIDMEPFTPTQAHIARAAYRRYGRGSGHRARLNFGDCFSYALAVERNEPLLYKGDDFNHTDVRGALD
jgi:ribonuclease VapC